MEGTASVKVDHQTLRDLEVLPDTRSSATLVDRLDRTVTRGGRNALVRRLTSPLTSPEEVHEVQGALRFLAAEQKGTLRLPGMREVGAVVRYVESDLVTLRNLRGPRSWWEAVTVRLRYPGHYEAAIEGSGLIRSFVALMDGIRKVLEDGPPILSGFAAQIEALISTPALKDGVSSVRGGWSWHRVLRSDRLFREEARASIRDLVEVVHQLDALVSMARATAELGLVFPEFTSGSMTLRLEGLWHPFLNGPVENDLIFENEERVMFLTGPNM